MPDQHAAKKTKADLLARNISLNSLEAKNEFERSQAEVSLYKLYMNHPAKLTPSLCERVEAARKAAQKAQRLL